MKFKHLSIEYIFFEITSKGEVLENITHSITYEKILELLQRKNFHLRRDDIVYLLKEDGAHFFDDSVRMFDAEENTYFQLPKDLDITLDPEEPQLSLRLWVKSTNPNFRKKLDDLTTDVKTLKENFRAHSEFVQTEIKSNFEKVNKEIENLRKANQILF